MRAVGYFRLAATKPAADSIRRQNRAFLDYCEAQGYEVATTFSENDPGEDWPSFGQMVEYLRQPDKGFMIVVAQAPAAFGDDAGAAAARCLQVEALGAKVQFISAPDVEPLAAVVNAWPAGEADSVGEKVRTAMRRKAVRGEVLGRPPYGYRVGPKNRLDPVAEEAVVVRYMFRLYLHEGLGIRLIARRLNEEGARTRRNRPWSMVSIRDILKNRVYLGTYQRLGFRVPGTHQALVSPEDFRRVQERLSDRRTNYSPRTVSPFLLSGLAECGNCGGKMIGVSRRQSWKRSGDGGEKVGSYRYYQCGSRTNQGICSYHTHRAEDLEAQVRCQIAEAWPKQPAIQGDDAAIIEGWQAEARRLRERVRQIDRRIAKALMSAEDLTAQRTLRSQAMALAEERLRVEEEARASEFRAEHYASAAERRRIQNQAGEMLIARWDALSMEGRRDLLREVIDRIIVADEDVRVVLRP